MHFLSFSRFLLIGCAGAFLGIEVKHRFFIDDLTAYFLPHSKRHICSGCNTGPWASANLTDIPPGAEHQLKYSSFVENFAEFLSLELYLFSVSRTTAVS